MKNHETTLKNHGNQPKTIKTIVLRYVTNTGSKLTTMIKKRDVTNTGPCGLQPICKEFVGWLVLVH